MTDNNNNNTTEMNTDCDHTITTAYPKKMNSDIFVIREDRKALETYDFYHYVGK